MNETFAFSYLKRLLGVRYPLGIMVSLAAMLAYFQPALDSWKLWAALLAITLMGVRVVQFLLEGNSPLTVSDLGITRSGRTVPYHSSQLELRVSGSGRQVQVEEAVLWTPRAEEGGRLGVGFDHSIEGFDRALSAIIGKVPELRIVLTAIDSPDVRDERREAVLARYRSAPSEAPSPEPTAVEKALAAVGKPKLGPPPKA